jgi:hypothetical protein
MARAGEPGRATVIFGVYVARAVNPRRMTMDVASARGTCAAGAVTRNNTSAVPCKANTSPAHMLRTIEFEQFWRYRCSIFFPIRHEFVTIPMTKYADKLLPLRKHAASAANGALKINLSQADTLTYERVGIWMQLAKNINLR